MKERDILIDDLRRLLAYAPSTGEFFWREGRACRGAPIAGAPAGHLHKPSGYWVIRVLGVQVRAHRVAVALMLGRWPPNWVDHIDRNRLNNRWSNLREVTGAENSQNRDPVGMGVTRVIGVRFDPGAGLPWEANISVLGRHYHLGRFETPREAVEARISAELRYFPMAPKKDAELLTSIAFANAVELVSTNKLDVPLIGARRRKRRKLVSTNPELVKNLLTRR